MGIARKGCLTWSMRTASAAPGSFGPIGRPGQVLRL